MTDPGTLSERQFVSSHPFPHIKVSKTNIQVYTACGLRYKCRFMYIYSLLVYSSGLFPLLSHGSMSVRPSLLDIYEKYYLAVGRGLIPCLPGMVLGLLPGLEDESEHTERYTYT